MTRGPESALYGYNAVAGVINIVSTRGDGQPHFDFLGEGGNLGTWRIATGGAGLNHGVNWAYNLSRLDSNGAVLNDDFENQSSFLSFGYSRSPRRQFNVHFFGDASNVGNPGPYGSDPDHLFPGIDAVARFKNGTIRLPGKLCGAILGPVPASHHRQRRHRPVFDFPSSFSDSFSQEFAGSSEHAE